MFHGNCGMLRFTIDNPKYLEGLGGLGGLGGPNPPLLRTYGWPTNILFTFLGICLHSHKFYYPCSLCFGPHTSNSMGWCYYKWSLSNCNHGLRHCHII